MGTPAKLSQRTEPQVDALARWLSPAGCARSSGRGCFGTSPTWIVLYFWHSSELYFTHSKRVPGGAAPK
eukprot:6631115-Prymnesium_polylepis.2